MIKKFVSVNVEINEEGKIKPLSLVFDDIRYEVDRVLDVRQAPNFNVGGIGIRYTIRVNGIKTMLWEEQGRWYVESKK